MPIGPDPARVVQVRVRPSFGTGYLIGPGLVLTAAHVVMSADGAPATGATVQAPGQAPAAGTVVWWRRDDSVDAALLRIAAAGDVRKHLGPATRFGSFASAEPNQPVEAIGFPRQQKFDSIRDQEQLVGSLSPETSALSGIYELTSTTPLPAPIPGGSRTPWSGMSGSGVFSTGLLIGVLRGDRRARSGARLTATSVAELLADQEFRRAVISVTGWDPVCEPVELARFLESPYQNRDVRSVASLLRADTGVVRFHGRESEIEQLSMWCARPEPHAVLILTGPGGEGKSRLARELLARQRSRGWTTGLLRPTIVDDIDGEGRYASIGRIKGPLLIAVDYAENHALQVRGLLRQSSNATGPVRVLLLARARGEWADALDEPDAGVRDMLASAPELALGPLTTTAADWDGSFSRAVHDIARALPSVPDHEEPDWLAIAERAVPPAAETSRRPTSALGIQMTALAWLLQQVMPVTAAPGEPVERTLLSHEEAYWTRTARRRRLRDLDRTTMRCAVAVLPLVTVADQDQAIRLLGGLGIQEADRAQVAAGWLRELYPYHEDLYLGLVQPDRLAEFLLIEACAAKPDLLTRTVSVASGLGHPRQLSYVESEFGTGTAAMFGQMTVLREAVRAARSQAYFGNPVEPLLTQIERTASGPALSDETLAWTVINVRSLPDAGRRQDVKENPDGSRTITSVLDAASAALEIAGYRRGAHSFGVDDARQQGFMHMLHALTLSQLGRDEEALEACAQAVLSFRSAPDSERDLADLLHQQADLLLTLDRVTEAVPLLREEVALRTGSQSDMLTSALNLLVNALYRSGLAGEASAYARQEIELRRPRSPAPTQANARFYVQALGRYAEILTDIGDHHLALEHCTRAEEFIADLPAATADGLSGDRAMLVDARARILDEAGDLGGSATAWLESAAAWEQLEEPYLDQDPMLRAVGSLNNAAVNYQDLGDYPRALEVIRAAMDLALGDRAEVLRRDHPERYELVHATYVGYLVRAGYPADALREAERLCGRAMPSVTPLPSSFANSMREVSLALANAGRPADAARASRIAVATLRATEASDHDRPFSILLASTLSDHAANLAQTGNGADGARAAAQAADVWRRICATEPRLRINLVTALANQAECFRISEQYAEAGDAFTEAADELRSLPDDDRPRDQVMLAQLLSGAAHCRFAVGDYQSAAQARNEEIATRRPRWRTDSSAGPALAKAYAELGAAYVMLDRLTEALSAAQQALDIFHQMYGQELGPHWQAVHRALLVCGTVLVRSDQPVAAVAPLARGMAIALRHGDTDMADHSQAGLAIAHAMDPVGVAAEWRRLTGLPYPGDPPVSAP
jgi:tetratricopeptide (TPR) repeat protein